MPAIIPVTFPIVDNRFFPSIMCAWQCFFINNIQLHAPAKDKLIQIIEGEMLLTILPINAPNPIGIEVSTDKSKKLSKRKAF
jgi:hypothetical protein